MKRKQFLCLAIIFFTVFGIGFGASKTQVYAESYYLGGEAAGFMMQTEGLTVIGLSDIVSKDGIGSPAADAELIAGDIIKSINSTKLNSVVDIEKALKDYDGGGVMIKASRNGVDFFKMIYPKRDDSGVYRLGLFVRDSISGIGTVTYISSDGRFGALGHPVIDNYYHRPVSISGGNAYKCTIIGVKKGEKGSAGELKGIIREDSVIGTINKNTDEGVFGQITNKEIKSGRQEIAIGNAKVGKAEIYTTVSGESAERFSISIVKIDENNIENKNLVIKITDEKLLDITGGIVQGMSGSPIVQDGVLVGAVTHVFLNDSTRGFGILIEKMLDN